MAPLAAHRLLLFVDKYLKYLIQIFSSTLNPAVSLLIVFVLHNQRHKHLPYKRPIQKP